jgi:hypothetical protein
LNKPMIGVLSIATSRAAGWQPEASYPLRAHVCQARPSHGSQ